MNIIPQLKSLKTQKDKEDEQAIVESKQIDKEQFKSESLGFRRRRAVLDSKRDNKVQWEIIFEGEKLDAPSVWRIRDRLIPRKKTYAE